MQTLDRALANTVPSVQCTLPVDKKLGVPMKGTGAQKRPRRTETTNSAHTAKGLGTCKYSTGEFIQNRKGEENRGKK